MKSILLFFISLLSVCILYTSLPCGAKRALKVSLEMEVPPESGGQRFNGANCSITYLTTFRNEQWQLIAIVPIAKGYAYESEDNSFSIVDHKCRYKYLSHKPSIYLLNEQFIL